MAAPATGGSCGGERWSLPGATALVTGGSKGIGHAIVEELAGFGARVHTCSRIAADQEECRRRWAEKGLSVTVSVCDVNKNNLNRTSCSCRQVRAVVGVRVRTQVNNAGIVFFKPTTECTAADYSRMMTTNLESCFHLSQLAHPLLLNASVAGGGSVVHVSSIGGLLAYPSQVLYATAKGALNQLTRSLAAEWACDRIRVNCVAPGITVTDMVKEVPEGALEQELSRIPMRRGGELVEVASLVSFLCMPAAS